MDPWWRGKGVGVEPDRCAEFVPDGLVMRQCRRRGGHGPGGVYCRQHAAMQARIGRSLRRAADRDGSSSNPR